MSLMDFLDDTVLGPLNYVDRIEWIVKAAIYRDIGHRMAIARFDKGGKHTLNEVEALLRRYGVDVYGRGHDARHMYFHVKRRQASWAEYLLLHAGVELHSGPIDRRNAGYAARHDPGWMPEPWADRRATQPAPSKQTAGSDDKQSSLFSSLLDFLNS